MFPLNSTIGERRATPTDPWFERLTADLRPPVKMLARQLVASTPGRAVLTFLHAAPHTAHTATDLAWQIDQPVGDVTAALASGMDAGWIEGVTAGDLLFYRLTSDPNRLRDLDEVFAWQAFWIGHVRDIAQAVGGPLPPPPHHPVGGSTPKEDGWYYG
jgi:hypothetical protein